MERRVLVAIFLSFLVLYGYQAFFVKPAPKPVTGAAAPTGSSSPATSASTGSSQSTASPASSPAEPPTAAPAPGVTALVGGTSEQDVRVETPQFVAVFTNHGGRLKSWRLKKFKDRNGDLLDLVDADQAAARTLPFSLQVPDQAATDRLNTALFAVTTMPPAEVLAAPADLKFEYRDSAGLAAVKEFRFDPAGYTVAFHATVTQSGQAVKPTILWGPGLGDTDSQTGRNAVKPGGLYSVGGKVSRLAARAVSTQPNYDQTFEYAGIDDHYFTSIALKPGPATVVYAPLSIPPPAGSKDPARDLMGYSITPAQDETVTFFIGPKDFDTLAAIDRNLVKAINFGMFSVIVVPLLRSLQWIHGFVGNYGWSILILTVLINLVLFPLNHKSVVSMRKMQEIQPETKAIQERYAKLKTTDPARQKMNQELMALYRDRGVNPASGCIPILLTLPVFLAFYAMLSTAIELRGAPFIGWIHDLSQPDAFYVLPILVGASQIVTQWMTPQTGVDPAQQKMMLIMPVVLIFIFISTPAGALIYWLTSNVWRLGQQYLTNYLIGPPNVRTVRPAAERRIKRAGAGKTDAAKGN